MIDGNERKVKATDDSFLSNTCESSKDKIKAQKELVEQLKSQWMLLWSERFEDKIRAEGVSVTDYPILSVEQGTIIHATKDFKALSFKEILEQHTVENPERFLQPDVHVGGWRKFVKTEITAHRPQKNMRSLPNAPKKQAGQHAKKAGHGWLHL
jgi:hypothetical protein